MIFLDLEVEMNKCKLETKVERLNLTLTSNTFTLSKRQDLVLSLSDEDLAIVNKNIFIKVTVINDKKALKKSIEKLEKKAKEPVKEEAKKEIKEEAKGEIKKVVKEDAKNQELKAKDLLKTSNKNSKKNKKK